MNHIKKRPERRRNIEDVREKEVTHFHTLRSCREITDDSKMLVFFIHILLSLVNSQYQTIYMDTEIWCPTMCTKNTSKYSIVISKYSIVISKYSIVMSPICVQKCFHLTNISTCFNSTNKVIQTVPMI